MLQDFWRAFKAIFSPDAGYQEAAERPCLRCAVRDASNARLAESLAVLRENAQDLAARAAETYKPKRKASTKKPAAKKTSAKAPAKKAAPRRRSR